MNRRHTLFLHGFLVCIIYTASTWMPSLKSSGGSSSGVRWRSTGLTSWHQHFEEQRDFDQVGSFKMKLRIPSALETKVRFQQSNISSFMSTFEDVTRSTGNIHIKSKIILMCIVSQFGLCGGIGDRIRGIPYAVALAILSDRELIVHPSLLSNGPTPQNATSETHYHFVDGSCTMQNIESLRKATAEIVFVTVNCEPLDPSLPFASTREAQQEALQNIHDECSISAYLCGAAAIHAVDAFKEGIDSARRLVGAMPMLAYRNYTALHVRAGGSMLTIDSTYTTKALRWQDGYTSDVPQLWLDGFKQIQFVDCQNHLAVVSDSVRLISELEFAAGDGLMITRCCSQPLHRDQTHRQEFFLQEIIDLFILAHSRKIIGGYGGFASLGRYWLGLEGPDMVIAKTKEDIENQVEAILRESECTGKEA